MRPVSATFRRSRVAFVAALLAVGASHLTPLAGAESTPESPEVEKLRRIYTEALTRGQAFANLRTLITESPGRLSGSKSLERAVVWAEETLTALNLDRVTKQNVLVPHWERGARETVVMTSASGAEPLNALALGGSPPTTGSGLVAEVTEVKSLGEVVTLGRAKIEGKIVFFNRPMDPAAVHPRIAYSGAVDQRSRGPATAARYGAAAVVIRSMTHAADDIPHTGNTTYEPNGTRIPAAALSNVAADKLAAALAAAAKSGGSVRLALKINSQWHADAPSHNVIGEIRGHEFPNEVILVGGHLDSWDVGAGAHDNGAGVVQSIEVLRIFRALGLKPRRTLRCVLFTNEENGLRGSTAYVTAIKAKGEKHVFAVETDGGGFQPRGFNLGSTQGNAHERAAAKWSTLFEPYGIQSFIKGTAGADIGPLLVQGVTVAGLASDSQRYFDYHHTTVDTIDKVNPRELHLGAAALASLIWLVDTQGL